MHYYVNDSFYTKRPWQVVQSRRANSQTSNDSCKLGALTVRLDRILRYSQRYPWKFKLYYDRGLFVIFLSLASQLPRLRRQ